MKQLLIILNLIFVICYKNAKAQDDNGLYSRRYERLDIDTILASPRLVTNYVDCLLNKKPCPPEGKALKKILPEALRTKCGKCWPNQKEGALKVITALYNDYPKHYNALRDKWDPTGEYHRRFEEYLRDQSFNSIGSNNNNNYQDNNDINQGQPSQVKTTVVTNTKNNISVQPTPSNSHRITSARSPSRNSNRIPSNQNHTINIYRIPPDPMPRNSKKIVSAKSHTQNSERKSPNKSSIQNSNRNENHNTNTNRISQNQNRQQNSNDIKSKENNVASSNRIASVENIPHNLNRINTIQGSPSNSNRFQSVQNSPENSNRIEQFRMPPQNANRIATNTQNSLPESYNFPSGNTPPQTANGLLSLQTPFFNFNLLPSIETPSRNLNRFSLTTPHPPKSNIISSNQNTSPFNFNIIPSIQTSINLNRVPSLLSPSLNNNRIPFFQSPAYLPPSQHNSHNSIQNHNVNHINSPTQKQSSTTNPISFRFSNDERQSQNDNGILHRSLPNIPKPTKISTNKLRTHTTTKITRKTTIPSVASTTKNPTSRRSNNNNSPRQSNVITERPTRQGIKTTTTVQPIIIPSTVIRSTTIRQSTIRTNTPKRERLSTTTTRSSTRRIITEPTLDINSPNDIINRFGGTDDENVASSTKTTTTTITRRPPRPLANQPERPNQPTPAVSSNQPQYMPGFVTTTTFNSNNQILNIINRLTTKLSNTADFVAGVLRVPQAIIQKTRNRHRVIWQNLAKNYPSSIQKQTTLTFRLF